MTDAAEILRQPLSRLLLGLAVLLEVGGLAVIIGTGNLVLGVGLMLAGVVVNTGTLLRIRTLRAAAGPQNPDPTRGPSA